MKEKILYNKEWDVYSNDELKREDYILARNVILSLQDDLIREIKKGCGPFGAAIYDENGTLIAEEFNSVVNDNCSSCHAELNTIKAAQQKLRTYDLSKYNASIYVTAEPCIMCMGGIMWSGIKNVYYGVSSKDVEGITGFDEGFKPGWYGEFLNRGIFVCGNIEAGKGKDVLYSYVKQNNIIYKPSRQDII